MISGDFNSLSNQYTIRISGVLNSMVITQVNNFISKFLLLFILATLAAGLVFEENLIRFSSILPYLFMIMVFNLGTSCSLESLKEVVRKPKSFILGFLIIYIVLPLIGYGLGWIFYGDSPKYAVGHFLLAVTPVAVTSMLWTGFLGGNLVLHLAIISLATVLSGFIIPFQVSFFMGEVVEFDAFSLMVSMSKMIVLPVIAGLLMRQKAPGLVEKIKSGANLINKFLMLFIIAVNGAAVKPNLVTIDWQLIRMFLIVALHLALNFSVSLLICWKILGKESKDLPPIVFASGMRNNAAGVVIALHYFGPEVALPVIICIFLQQLTAGAFYSLIQKFLYKPRKTSGSVTSVP